MFNHFHQRVNYEELVALASHLNNYKGCLSSIQDGADDVMGGSLKSVLFANIDQILNKHNKLKKKSLLKEDDVEIIEAFKSNLQA